MKISDADYQALKTAVQGVVTKHPGLKAEYEKAGFSDMRFNWDVLRASKFDILGLYSKGLNDEHINTALKKALGNTGMSAKAVKVAKPEDRFSKGEQCPDCGSSETESNGGSEHRCVKCDHRWGFDNGERYGF